MQYNFFSQILCKNQFSFFGSCVYKTYFNNSDESITWVPKTIENAFINLNQVWNSRLWFSSWGFNFQLEDSLSNSGLQFFNLRIFGNFLTWGFFELEDSLLNSGLQFWMWGFNFEFEDSILNSRLEFLSLRIQFWTWRFALELQAPIFNLRIEFWTWGFNLELWGLQFLNLRIQLWTLLFALELRASILNLRVQFWYWGFALELRASKKNIRNLTLAAETGGPAVVRWSRGLKEKNRRNLIWPPKPVARLWSGGLSTQIGNLSIIV